MKAPRAFHVPHLCLIRSGKKNFPGFIAQVLSQDLSLCTHYCDTSSRWVTFDTTMAESQLVCMEDGHIGAKVPESKPEFYYSEEQRGAIEELLKNGDGAFKSRLKEENMTDFLSAREIKLLLNTFKHYDSSDERTSTSRTEEQEGAARSDADSGVHSTYWPQMSDTEVPPLDLGWPSGGLFKGVTRVAVHTHPPKDNGPHIKEVVRRLIQEASKVGLN